MTLSRALSSARGVALVGLVVVAAVIPRPSAPAADHRDGPIFINTALNGQADINDIYVFQSPSNANNTVLIFDVQPFPGNLTPTTFDPTVQYSFQIDTNGDAVPDLTFLATFGTPNATGVQSVCLRGLPSTKFPPTGIIAQGQTGQNIPIAGGGMFRAAIQDDPFFFDAGGFKAFLDGTSPTFPRPVGTAHNFFGPNGNTLSIIVEIPSSRLGAANAIIGVFVTTTRGGVQQDRMGRPAINTALIPPVPHTNLARGDRRNAFNAGLPRNDLRDFQADMSSVFSGFYGRPVATANTLTSVLLPDMLMFQIGNSSGFGTFLSNGTILGNGRRLSNDVIDFELNVITGGAITTDNVGDDNGLKVTDGSVDPVSGKTRSIAFPYIGAPNTPLNGAGTGPNP